MTGVGYQNGNRRTFNTLEPSEQECPYQQDHPDRRRLLANPGSTPTPPNKRAGFWLAMASVHRFYHRIFKI